jgi:glycosyltransferase involved in cell wall biosynthesis
MRILILTHHRRFKAAWRCLSLARQLALRGHDVTMLCTADTERWRLTEYVEDGVTIVEVPDLLTASMRSGWDPYTVFRRIHWLKNAQFDLLHTFETRPASIYPALSLLKRRKIPLVIDWIDWWGHGGLITEHRPRWYQFLFGGIETWYEEHFRTMADATTVIARGLGRRAEGLGVDEESIFWIPNGCDPNLYESVKDQNFRPKFGIPDEAFVAGFSALDVTLGVDTVLRALSLLKDRYPDIRLLMTGKKDDSLMAAIDAAGVADTVTHLGYVDVEDYPKALACVDTFVVPFGDRVANAGRWPGRINDYLSLGIPIITNPVGEMSTLLASHKIGLLAPETPEGFADALTTMIEDPDLRRRMGQTARDLAGSELAWSTLIDRLEHAYHFAIDHAETSTVGANHHHTRGSPAKNPAP